MKVRKLLALTLFISSCAIAQDFEGKIIYQNSYKSATPSLTDQQLGLMMGTTQEYMIKGGNYKSVSNGTFMQWQLYINKDNKLYTKMSNSEAVLWNDGDTNPDEVQKAEVNKGAITILGYVCDELVLTCKSGVQKYYFNSSLKIDPKLFEKHKFGNWSEYISRSKAVPLKMILTIPQFTVECVATEVKPLKLEDKEFTLPLNIKTAKSPY